MQKFNLAIQLKTFEKRRRENKKVKSQHASLYFSLLTKWLDQKDNPILLIKSREMMRASRIGSRAAYFRYMQELVKMEFIARYDGKSRGAIVVMKHLQ
jgi:hypothetical protein